MSNNRLTLCVLWWMEGGPPALLFIPRLRSTLQLFLYHESSRTTFFFLLSIRYKQQLHVSKLLEFSSLSYLCLVLFSLIIICIQFWDFFSPFDEAQRDEPRHGVSCSSKLVFVVVVLRHSRSLSVGFPYNPPSATYSIHASKGLSLFEIPSFFP